jgi:RNA polymerase-binding transcription factor DksA
VEDRADTGRLREQVGRSLEEIDRALAKARQGDYGQCERCGAAIGQERLEVLPAARYCLPCERAQE